MRILLDHNVPAPLRYSLIGHQVETAYERNWAELTNGELLDAAEQVGFDAMITTDQGICHQQNLADRRLTLVLINTNDWTRIRKWKALVAAAIAEIRPGATLRVEIPSA
jgi:predicted nuclease of predicted toxin-antitoxin system